MGLQLDEAVDDFDAGPFQIARPSDIGLFVEARLELDQRGDGLAGFGRFDQRPTIGEFFAGAIKRLLDRNDIGVRRRLTQELHHHVEDSRTGGEP